MPRRFSSARAAEKRVDLDADRLAVDAEGGRRDRRVVADAAADVEEAVGRVQFEEVEPGEERDGVAVVQRTGRVERDEHRRLEMHGVAVRRLAVRAAVAGVEELPGAGADEIFAADRGEAASQARIPQVRDFRDLVREALPGPLEVAHAVTEGSTRSAEAALRRIAA